MGELVPKVSQPPPTLPRLPSPPSRAVPQLPSAKRVSGTHHQTGVQTLPSGPSKRRTTSDRSVPHHVQFTAADANTAAVNAGASIPAVSSPTEESSTASTGVHSAAEPESPEGRPSSNELASPQGQQHDAADETARGRKLSFLRKHLSPSRSSPKRPPTRRVGSHGSLPASRGASPARPDQSASSKSGGKFSTSNY